MPPEGGRRGTRRRRGGRPRGAGRIQAVGVTCIGSTGAWRAPAVGILSALGSRLSALGSRLSALGSRLSALGSRLSALGSRLSALGSRLSALGSRLSALGSRLSALGSLLFMPSTTSSGRTAAEAVGAPHAAVSIPLLHSQLKRIATYSHNDGTRHRRVCPRLRYVRYRENTIGVHRRASPILGNFGVDSPMRFKSYAMAGAGPRWLACVLSAGTAAR